MNEDETTHFGYTEVPLAEKTRRVAAVFHAVANKYDVMNDAMSLGVHRLWKRYAVELSGARAGQQVLDLASGTGDLVKLLAPKVGRHGMIVASDINASMLDVGRARLVDAGVVGNVCFALNNAEILPFADNSFDLVTIAFGLRNVTHKERALAAMQRVLKPGGRALILEFSQPVLQWLRPVYDAYSFNVLPWLGQLIADDAASYRYLVESIRKHPSQVQLQAMMETAGFMACDYFNLSGGIVAVHRGFKF